MSAGNNSPPILIVNVGVCVWPALREHSLRKRWSFSIKTIEDGVPKYPLNRG